MLPADAGPWVIREATGYAKAFLTADQQESGSLDPTIILTQNNLRDWFATAMMRGIDQANEDTFRAFDKAMGRETRSIKGINIHSDLKIKDH